MQLVMLHIEYVKMIVCLARAIKFIEITLHYLAMQISVEDRKLYHSLTTIKYYQTLKIHVLLI